jgi:death-on-curing protein
VSRVLRHLGVPAVKAIHREVLLAHGGRKGVREEIMLESGVAAAQATWDGDPLISEPVEVAAAYLFYLCRNHPFIDGNKRTALAACLVFLDRNDLLPAGRLPADAWERLVLDVANSTLDRSATGRRLHKLLQR